MNSLICMRCESPAEETDTYCRNCGGVFADNLPCSIHGSRAASGVCVICALACCDECGGDRNGTFLCDKHWEYEVQEGYARVFGSIDNVQAQHVTSCLKQAGFHPFFYSRGFNPGPGMVGPVVLGAIRNYGNHPIAEMKVLVPYAEVLEADRVLRELGFLE
jgi:hypothetical protein